MDEQNNHSIGPWDDSVYGTGSTQPPKNHNSLVAVLLILVIFLSGIVTLMGLMNIRLFRTIRQQENDLAISFALEPEETVPAMTQPANRAHSDHRDIDLHDAPPHPDRSDGSGELSLQQIYAQCIPSVVSITCRTPRGGSSTGTGVILTEEGYIVTNAHVIENAAEISIRLTDDRELTAGIVGSDPVSDLAVLFIEADGLTPAQFGDSEALQVGDSVVAIGDPLGVEFRGTMTNGIISAINRDVTLDGRTLNLIQTNAALNSGNSGGPLINCYGQVIGINTMKIGAFADTAGVEGLGFAIPSATVKDIVHQILEQGYVSGRPYLGIQGETFSPFYQHFYGMPGGLYITQVVSGSPADRAGLESGDILMAFDDTRISSMDSLIAALYSHQAGDTVRLTVYHKGYQGTIQVTLAEATGK